MSETDPTSAIQDGGSDKNKDPTGSSFVNRLRAFEFSDEEIAEKMDKIPNGMFSLKDPTEIEILASVFDGLDMIPLIDEIQALREQGEIETASKCQNIRDSLMELLRMSINAYREKFMPGGERDIDKLYHLYETTQAIDQSDILRALDYLKSKHRGSLALFNAEAVIRSMYLD